MPTLLNILLGAWLFHGATVSKRDNQINLWKDIKLHPRLIKVYFIHKNNSQNTLSVPVTTCGFQTHLRHNCQNVLIFGCCQEDWPNQWDMQKEFGYHRAAVLISERWLYEGKYTYWCTSPDLIKMTWEFGGVILWGETIMPQINLLVYVVCFPTRLISDFSFSQLSAAHFRLRKSVSLATWICQDWH